MTFTHVDSSLPNGVQVQVITRENSSWLKKIRGLFRTYVINGYSLAIEKALTENIQDSSLLWVSRLSMAKYIPKARKMGYHTILDEQNIESDLLQQLISNHTLNSFWHYPWYLYQRWLVWDCRRQEVRFCQKANAVVVTSDLDRDRLQHLTPKTPITLIPNRIDTQFYQESLSHVGTDLLFVGTLNYYPNIEGLTWFLDSVYPLLKQKLLNLPAITVVGAHPSPELKKKLEAHSIQIVCNPESILPYLKKAMIVFVPILAGGGTRLKILEAMAAGRSIVSTSRGAEGIQFTPGIEIAIADTPLDFAESIIELLQDPARRKEMGRRSSVRVQNLYDWNSEKTEILTWLKKIYENSANR